MPPLYMDSKSGSPGFASGGESDRQTGSETRAGKVPRIMKRGDTRRAMNRDLARKSRRRQTERADELHEELQCLERSNSALEKEIATLRVDLRGYSEALQRHAPLCRLRLAYSDAPPPPASTAATPFPGSLQGGSRCSDGPHRTSPSYRPPVSASPAASGGPASAGPASAALMGSLQTPFPGPYTFLAGRPAPGPGQCHLHSPVSALTSDSLSCSASGLVLPSRPSMPPPSFAVQLPQNLIVPNTLPRFHASFPGMPNASAFKADTADPPCSSRAAPSIPGFGPADPTPGPGSAQPPTRPDLMPVSAFAPASHFPHQTAPGQHPLLPPLSAPDPRHTLQATSVVQPLLSLPLTLLGDISTELPLSEFQDCDDWHWDAPLSNWQ